MDIIESANEKRFPNGDIYVGDFMGILPHGKGKYSWSDGTIYEGDFVQGKLTGKGKIIFPSKLIYEGDFSGNYLHGSGTCIYPNGSVYRGSWRMNVQHGLGRKEYCNSDIYDGSWKEGVEEGNGSYSWSNGTTYVGNFKKGKMCGRGYMKWTNGDLFDGFWVNGVRNGTGCYKFADGSYYFGSWTKNLKDGLGTYYPNGTKHPLLSYFRSVDKIEGKKKGVLSNSSSSISEDNGKVQRSTRIKRSFSEKFSDNNLCDSTREPNEVFEREYTQGVLIRERVKKSTKRLFKSRKQFKFHPREETRNSCVSMFQLHKSYYLMLNLQLGIRHTVGKITPVPMREVRYSDFGDRARIQMYFPRKGSQSTPSHYCVNFYWKDYCPMVFRNLREMFKLDAAEYMMSICGDDGLREISSPGKSGCFFYISHDDRFFIKTLRKSELKVLLKMLPSYYEHVQEHENTLITKFFGIHRITLRGRKKVRFVVMGNMFCTELRIHRHFDLKGSTLGRTTNRDNINENTTLKDLDLTYEFHMDKLLRESLFTQLELDSTFLESQHIIDYSLLMGLHFRAPQQLDAMLEAPDGAMSQEMSIPPKGLLLVTHEPNSVSTAPGPHVRGNTLRAFSVGDKEVDLLLPGTARLRVQLGVNMPAQAIRKLQQEETVDSGEVELFEVYDVVLYLGVIDILQDYNMRKRTEHAYKSLKYDPLSISCVDPKFYSRRFMKFLEKVFPWEPELT